MFGGRFASTQQFWVEAPLVVVSDGPLETPMRWFWIDRFVEFQSGRRAVSTKNVTLAEDHLHEQILGFQMMPHPLIIEGLAQTGGILVAEYNEFRERVVLAKIAKASFFTHAIAGDTLTYSVELQNIQNDGAVVSGTSHIGDRLQCAVELFFAHVRDPSLPEQFFEKESLLAMLQLLKLYEVGKAADGSPLAVPDSLLPASPSP